MISLVQEQQHKPLTKECLYQAQKKGSKAFHSGFFPHYTNTELKANSELKKSK